MLAWANAFCSTHPAFAVTKPTHEPQLPHEGCYRGCRARSELQGPRLYAWGGSGRCQVGPRTKATGSGFRYLAALHGRGLLFEEKEVNPEGTEPKGLVCKFVGICNPGWVGRLEIRNPANWSQFLIRTPSCNCNLKFANAHFEFLIRNLTPCVTAP